ncbi:amino acid permease [Haladaptatus sp. W1]|uniref:amino acid permease n=1 Tax=Haladaptatus sp. W1 TaxID=1897478 RepID=UPI000849AF0D|nr:amino acid permease [Haladaptatus sp. W1]ODR81016.1 amino acid permease [Haladaptatus sp. W1]
MVEHTRTLGFKVAFALGLGTMIAAGIFSLSGTAVAAVGSSAIISFVIAAVIASITAYTYSEFASIYSENGGGYLFSSRTFEEDRLLFAIGSSLFLGYCATTAFYLATMGEWFHQFIIPHGIPIPHGGIAVLTAILLGYLNSKGTEESGTFQVLVTSAKVAVLVVFVAGAFGFAGPTQAVGEFATGFQTDVGGIVSVAAVAFITFFGFSAIAASAGEIIEPRKTVPKAIAASILTVTVLYIFVIVAMVNSPIPAEVVARQGETAMGKVAAAFLGSFGKWLIVAGAIFSMVSASNASILAASGIGSLMGKQGQAPRRFSRIHPTYATPFWSVITTTGVISALIVAFITLFPSEGGVGPLHLGLNALTGFANLNLLAPLAVVNVALIASRRRFPDLERPIRVPFSPWLPVLGIVANLALIAKLPPTGIAVGVAVELLFIAAYLVWGGAPNVDELVRHAVEQQTQPLGTTGDNQAEEGTLSELDTDTEATGEEPEDRYRVLVPMARINRAPDYVRLAAKLANARAENPIIHVLNVTHIPDQTPYEMVQETAEKRADRLMERLETVDVNAEYTVGGHISRDVGFDINETARSTEVDLILMGYPEEHYEIAESVEYNAPCDVLFAQNFDMEGSEELDAINVGVGGGPHHESMLSLVGTLGKAGATVHVINVTPTGNNGTPEEMQETLDELPPDIAIERHEVTAESVADGVIDVAAENGGPLFIGASRTRLLKRWVLGSTPDQVIQRADAVGVPVIVYATPTGITGRLGEALTPLGRLTRRVFRRDQERDSATPVRSD